MIHRAGQLRESGYPTLAKVVEDRPVADGPHLITFAVRYFFRHEAARLLDCFSPSESLFGGRHVTFGTCRRIGHRRRRRLRLPVLVDQQHPPSQRGRSAPATGLADQLAWAWAGVGFAVGAVGGTVRAIQRADHARKTRELSETLGREYTESYSLPPEAKAMPAFEGWSNGRNAMTGHERGLTVTLFDYTTVTQGGESNTVTEGTAVLLLADGLPNFDLHPRTFGRRVLGWAGLEGLTFDPAGTNPPMPIRSNGSPSCSPWLRWTRWP